MATRFRKAKELREIIAREAKKSPEEKQEERKKEQIKLINEAIDEMFELRRSQCEIDICYDWLNKELRDDLQRKGWKIFESDGYNVVISCK